jgi:hypothetical protein
MRIIYLPNGNGIPVRGDYDRKEMKQKLLICETAETGHPLVVKVSEIVMVEEIPDAEWNDLKAKQLAQAEAKQRAESDALKKAADEFIAVHGPNPGRWPQKMVPGKRVWTPQ